MIPNSKWQKSQQKIKTDILGTHAGERFVGYGTLLEVWDQEKLSLYSAPPEVLRRIAQAPGVLFGLVQVGVNQYYLAFNENEDFIYLVYGNYSQLEGRKVKIEYENANIINGKIILQKTLDKQHLNLDLDFSILDIGGVV